MRLGALPFVRHGGGREVPKKIALRESAAGEHGGRLFSRMTSAATLSRVCDLEPTSAFAYPMKPLSIDAVASIIGVSNATVRNWVKAGHLTPARQRPLSIFEKDALQLKRDISSGSLARLRTRANKSGSEVRLIPKEYSNNPPLLSIVDAVVAVFQQARLDLATTMYIISLRLLELRGEVVRSSCEIYDLNSFHSWKRKAMREVLASWHAHLPTFSGDLNAHYRSVYFSVTGPQEGDVLGLVYQSLCNEGHKSQAGSYYTPTNIVRASLTQGASVRLNSFLDPCCGTGTYLLCAADVLGLSIDQLYGFDNDDIAACIARINLLLAFPSADSPPISAV